MVANRSLAPHLDYVEYDASLFGCQVDNHRLRMLLPSRMLEVIACLHCVGLDAQTLERQQTAAHSCCNRNIAEALSMQQVAAEWHCIGNAVQRVSMPNL